MKIGVYAAELGEAVHIDKLADVVEESLQSVYPDEAVTVEETEVPVYNPRVDRENVDTMEFQFYPETQRESFYVEDEDGNGDVIWLDEEADTVVPGYQVETHLEDGTVHVSFSAYPQEEETDYYQALVLMDAPHRLVDKIGEFVGVKSYPGDEEYAEIVDRLDGLEEEVSDCLGMDVTRTSDIERF